MPLGNYTSQFFANVYLGRFDHFVKHSLKAKNYIRYVDDLVILHRSKRQLEIWKEEINDFLNLKLNLILHPQKSRIVSLSRGVDFVGFRNFTHYKLLRKRNIKKITQKIKNFENEEIDFIALADSYQEWQAHANWADTYKLSSKMKRKIIEAVWRKV